MMKLAEPLLIVKKKGIVRFVSLMNARIFSFLAMGNYFEFVELEDNGREPFILKYFYMGCDADEVMKVILKEVCDVRS